MCCVLSDAIFLYFRHMADILRTALVQTSLIWEDPAGNLKRIAELLRPIADVDLIILPEMFSTGFTMEPHRIPEDWQDKTIQWMQEQAIRSNAAVTGSIIAQQNGRYYNRLYFIHSNGEISTYDKRHTFTLAGEDKFYARGSEKVIIEYKGFRICPMICYDLRFPVWSRNTENFDVLLYVANWPKARISAWDTLLKARAIENMVYTIGVNRIGSDNNGLQYNGHSGVYDALGEALVFAELDDTILTAELNKEHLQSIREKLKFLEDRDIFNLQL